jgi:hypothetical protein
VRQQYTFYFFEKKQQGKHSVIIANILYTGNKRVKKLYMVSKDQKIKRLREHEPTMVKAIRAFSQEDK